METQQKLPQTFVHVTLAMLGKPGSFFTSNEGNGFVLAGSKITMGTAVFCGKVLGTKVKKNTSNRFQFHSGIGHIKRECTRNLLGRWHRHSRFQ